MRKNGVIESLTNPHFGGIAVGKISQIQEDEGLKEIHYIQQPTEYLCGQACVAMIAGVSVDDVIRVMNNDQSTGKKDIEWALDHYGIRQAKTMTKANSDTPLPPVCILKVLLPRYSHWVFIYHGKYYDPEFGLMDELYCKAKIQSYLELFTD